MIFILEFVPCFFKVIDVYQIFYCRKKVVFGLLLKIRGFLADVFMNFVFTGVPISEAFKFNKEQEFLWVILLYPNYKLTEMFSHSTVEVDGK